MLHYNELFCLAEYLRGVPWAQDGRYIQPSIIFLKDFKDLLKLNSRAMWVGNLSKRKEKGKDKLSMM